MHKLYDDLTDICEALSDELAKANDKLEAAGGRMSSADLDYVDKLTHAIKSVKTTVAMLESEGGYSRMSRPRYSYDDYSYGRGRDSMGRYTSRDEGPRHVDGAIMELKEAMEKAPDERSRMKIKQLIEEMEIM